MNTLTITKFTILQKLLEINFYFSAALLICGSIFSISDEYTIFTFNEDLYGALDNNLRMIMVYLGVTEAVMLMYCLLSGNFRLMLPVGFFLVMMIGSLEFYGEINTIQIDPQFPLFFLYTGISHAVYGILVDMKVRKSIDQDNKYEIE